jgi:hypothetical protein
VLAPLLAGPFGTVTPQSMRSGNRRCRGPDAQRRQRLNIHGAIDLETGATRMIDVPTVPNIGPGNQRPDWFDAMRA